MTRKLSRADSLVQGFDTALRTLMPGAARASRPSPASREVRDGPMEMKERRHAAGLLRITHTGEVCAQALYQGQGLTARLPELQSRMEVAGREGIDHLAWCDARLKELHGRTSHLNPLLYAASLGVGVVAGAMGDRVGLGVVVATEEQRGGQLDKLLERLPRADQRSRAVLSQIRLDEAHHAQLALEAGGMRFPAPLKVGMSLMAEVVSRSVYGSMPRR